MSVHDDLTAAQRSFDELTRAVGRLEKHLGGSLDIRRMRAGTDHLRESLALLVESTPQGRTRMPDHRPEMILIPDAPYNTALWADAEDEGLGACDRHAP
jgi:hypothetical protein